MRYLKQRKGQTIIEMIIALSALAIGFLGVVALLNGSFGYMQLVTEEYTATYLAAEGVELMHNLINENLRQSYSWRRGIREGVYELDYLTLVDADTTCNYLTSSQVALAATGKPLLFDRDNRSFSYVDGEEAPYRRSITVQYESVYELDSSGNRIPDPDNPGQFIYAEVNGRQLIDDIMKVTSRVEWRGLGGQFRDLQLESHFYNWHNSPNPSC